MGILDRLAKGAESIVEGAADVAGSRAVTGITTGLLSAKIRNSEANDALKANVLARVGDTLLSETIPNAIESEKIRRNNYDVLVGRFGVPGANLLDANKFTLNKETMDQLDTLLEKNELNDEMIKNAKFETDFNTRYNQRVKSAGEKYNPILKKLGIDNIGGLGFSTVEALVKPMKTEDMAKGPVPSDAFSSMQIRDYLTKIPEPSRVETKFEKLKINVLDRNKPYGNYNISTSAEGGYIFNIADQYSTMYDIHLDINDAVESSRLGSGKTQSEIASISTQLIQDNIIKPAQALTLAKSGDGFETTGLNTYIDINTITENKNKSANRNFNVDLKNVKLRNDQKFAIYDIIKQVDESKLTDYGINRNLYNAIKQSENAGAFSQTNPQGFKEAYTAAVLITADNIDQAYGDKASRFFLSSLANVKNENGAVINDIVSFRLNQIKANRLNNR